MIFHKRSIHNKHSVFNLLKIDILLSKFRHFYIYLCSFVIASDFRASLYECCHPCLFTTKFYCLLSNLLSFPFMNEIILVFTCNSGLLCVVLKQINFNPSCFKVFTKEKTYFLIFRIITLNHK